MLKVVKASLFRLGQDFLDEVWGDEEEEDVQPIGKISPDGPDGVINEDNFESFEPDQPEAINPEQDVLDFQQEIPTRNENLGIPAETREIIYDGDEGKTTDQMLVDAMAATEVVSFDYTNRFGQYAGTRTVEPHYTFDAVSTGNEVLVTWDRDVNDIRAFIVGNIHPFGVRYKDVNFQPRGEIMRGTY